MRTFDNHVYLIQSLNTWVQHGVVPAEIKEHLELLVAGNPADCISEAADLLYAHYDELDLDGRHVMGSLFAFADRSNWSAYCADGRCTTIRDMVRRDLGEAPPAEGWPTDEDAPEPKKSLRGEVDWREGIAFNVAGAKVKKRKEVEGALAGYLRKGFSPASGPLAGHTLQMRGLEDQANWLNSAAAYAHAKSLGAGPIEGAKFRTADNATVMLTYDEGHAVLMDMSEWGAQAYDVSWSLKDQIEALSDTATQADFDAIDVAASFAALDPAPVDAPAA